MFAGRDQHSDHYAMPPTNLQFALLSNYLALNSYNCFAGDTGLHGLTDGKQSKHHGAVETLCRARFL